MLTRPENDADRLRLTRRALLVGASVAAIAAGFGALRLWPSSLDPLLADASYSWWINTPSINRDDTTYFSYIEPSTGDQYLASRHNSWGPVDRLRLRTGYLPDDHNAAAIGFLPDGRLYTFYTGHNDDGVFRWRVSSDSSVAGLGSERSVAFANSGTSYAQTMVFRGEVFTFVRRNNIRWWLVHSKDGLRTAEIMPQAIVESSQQYYMLCRQLPGQDRIRAFSYRNPRYAPKLQVFDIDMSAADFGLVRSGDASFGYIDGRAAGDAVLPVKEEQLVTLFTPAKGESMRLFDVSDDGETICYGLFADGQADLCRYWIARLTGADAHNPDHWTHTMLEGVETMPFDEVYGHYYPGLCIAREPHGGERLYVASGLDGLGLLERWDSADGVTWVREEIRRQAHDVIRPYSPVNATRTVAVTWCEGEYSDYGSKLDMHAAAAPEGAWQQELIPWRLHSSPRYEGRPAALILSWNHARLGRIATATLTEVGGEGVFVNTFAVDAATAVANTKGISFDASTLTFHIQPGAVSPITIMREVLPGAAGEWRASLSAAAPGTIRIADATMVLQAAPEAAS